MFLTSHFYGPFIGLALALFLVLLGFPLDGRVLGFAGLVCLFWPYCFVVGRVPYQLLSLGSLQHLCLVIMWGSHGYGGLASPFLLWLAVVPLLAFLYLSPNQRLWMLLIAMIAANTAGLALVSLVYPPPPVDPAQMRWLALVSALSAATYVSMMAVHFGRVLNSRDAIEKEMALHRQTAAALVRLADGLKQAEASKARLLAGIGPRAQAPLAEIVDAGEQLNREVAARSGAALADVRCITEAARYLVDLIRDIDLYGGLDTADVRTGATACDLKAVLDAATEGRARPVRVEAESRDLPGLFTHAPLLKSAIGHALDHLGQRAPGGPVTLCAARLPSEAGDHVVIDLSRDDGGHATGGSTSRGSLKLALASRIVSKLGGKLDPHSGRGCHIRIRLPARLPA